MRFGHNALDFLVNFITYLEPPYSLDFNYIAVPLLAGFFVCAYFRGGSVQKILTLPIFSIQTFFIYLNCIS
jgi:hypothetical protein